MSGAFRSIARIIATFVMLFSLASCGQPGQSPLPTATGTAPAQAGTLTIGYAGMYMSVEGGMDKAQMTSLDESLIYMHRLLRGRGWDIDLTTKHFAIEGQDPVQTVVDAVKVDLAAGAAADGYIVWDSVARALLDAGLTIDPRGVLTSAAPAFYDRYRVLIDGGAGGVPLYTSLFSRGLPIPVVLCIEKGVAAKAGNITCLSDVLTFLENNADVQIGASYHDRAIGPARAWAGEQGYYPLDEIGMGGELYARQGDESCKVVPVEDIPGFDAFFVRCMKLIGGGRLAGDYSSEGASGETVVGYIGRLQDDMGYQFLLGHGKTGLDYLAFPLKGCAERTYQPAEPVASFQLALCSATGAGQLAKFAEWVLCDEKNYRLLRYGAEGVDYRLVDGRMEYLNYRQPLRLEDWDGKTKAFFRNYFSPFYDASMERAMVYAPANYAELRAAAQPLSQPAYELIDRLQNEGEGLLNVQNQFDGLASERNELLLGTPPVSSSTAEDRAAKCLAQLRGLRAVTDKMVAAYQERIDELLAAQGTAGK